ncbi:heterokaryon incompatibility protein [Stagonosporopsis vannaccii]|nr:heterokaryon incompatibility protein [Stagonosporopsis vannaccii]
MDYRDQLSGRNIRLLSLESGTYKSPIKCHLIEASLDDLPEYEALSYAWGDSTSTEQIVCNGQIHHVTTNAARAMRRIRLGISPLNSKKETADPGAEYANSISSRRIDEVTNPSSPHVVSVDPIEKRYRPKLLWIDMLCIDQANNAERNHQVQLMREIYSKASRVIVWLGDTKASGKRMTALNAIIQLIAQNFTLKDLPRYKVGALTIPQVKSRLGYSTWDDMWHVISAAFISEWYTRVWCVQEIVLAQDSILLFRNAELYCDDMAKLCTWLKSHLHGKRAWKSSHHHNVSAFSNLFVAAQRFRAATLDEDQRKPEKMLYSSRKLEAKDPRDRFYGLLGLFEEISVDVDYTKSIAEVYRDSVLQTTTDGLCVLSYVYHGYTYSHREDWPSWVPDWQSRYLPRPMYPTQSRTDKASLRQVSSHDAELARAGCLQLNGILCDTVVTITRHLHVPSGDTEQAKAHIHEEFLHLWDKASHTPSLSTLLPWARIFTGGGIYDVGFFTASRGERERRLVADFRAYIHDMGVEEQHRDEGTVSCRKKILESIHTRRAFLTSKMWLGLGPVCMQPGDVVAVFHGGVSPHVLRPVPDRPDHYHLMGECYVHDLTNEGAYKMLKKDTVEEKVFNLI